MKLANPCETIHSRKLVGAILLPSLLISNIALATVPSLSFAAQACEQHAQLSPEREARGVMK